MQFVAAKPSDAAVIPRLRRRIWTTTYRGIYPDEMIDRFDYAWHEERDAQRIDDPAYAVYLVRVSDRLAGYICLRKRNPAQLLSLYVEKAFQDRGIGRRAFGFVKTCFAVAGVPAFICQCQPDNTKAIRFYRRNGGRVIREDLNHEARWQDAVIFLFDVNRESR